MKNLSDAIQHLEADGYCRIPNVYGHNDMTKALDLVQEWYQKTKDAVSEDLPYLAQHDPYVWNLQSKDYYFLELLFSQEIIQDILMNFMNDIWYKQIPQSGANYILRSYLARSSTRPLPMHIDSFVPYGGSHVFIMQVAIILQDQNTENGCTIVVPGSHKSNRYVGQSARQHTIPIESKSGDLVIWDSRLWHGTTENRSGQTRWSMIATFCRWWIKQHFNITQNFPQEIYEKLTSNQKAIMGFCSIPNNNENEGVDMKRGYETLLGDVSEYRL